MNGATTFSLRFIAFALIHSLLASDFCKKAGSRYLPAALQRFYRLSYNLLSLVIFAWVMAAYPLPPVLYIVPGAWSLVCTALQLILLLLLYRCAAQTGLAALLGLQAAETGELCTTGCYGLVRHPLYSLSAAFLIVTPVMTVKWLLLTVFSCCYFVVGAIIEEQRLGRKFGDTYRNYRRRVPMFIPRISKSKDPTFPG
ncbi:hypothetical protein GURASL_20080 [Geotalea uraniireducens]|uniref:Methanethiol S-methyltransferase n=1 Tax=Geotalea uraniireducens TaxID=351604 RepID=A0ABM8EL91_9BACT|nr:isoprenylcysteine carboxylmethyltransferase family protein [Geotalea uraniireducens]BDV43085.1 hypothetical protein GURASL_20080 [Geotalea uraniireducens]